MTSKSLGADTKGRDIVLRTLNLTKLFMPRFPLKRLTTKLSRDKNQPLPQGKLAVNNVNLTVPEGEIYGYLGPNGAGKTTTIRMITGLLRPTKGTISICGHTIHDDLRAAKQHTGYMPDHVYKFPSQKPVDFLALYGQFSGLPKDSARSRALELLSWAQLDDKLNEKISNWSSGQQRKLLLLQAILHKPDLLVLDEPTANLDPSARRELINLLKKTTRTSPRGDWRATVFLSSHDLAQVEEVCTRFGFLTRGSLVLEDTKENVHKRWRRLTLEEIFLSLARPVKSRTQERAKEAENRE